MAATDNDNDDLISAINVTPMVDIVLVLLIIFMVTANIIAQPAIKVSLPKAANADPGEASTLALILTKNGDLYLNGELTTEEELSRFVPTLLAESKEVQAIIAADQDARHGDVIHVIDLIKGLGVTKFALNIELSNYDEAGTAAP